MPCPRCGSTLTIKKGLSKYGVQCWVCKKCRRDWREHLVPRQYDLEQRYGHGIVLVSSEGVCLKCGKNGGQKLANGLCLGCYDEANPSMQLYYRRKLKGICVRCHAPATEGIHCRGHRRHYDERRQNPKHSLLGIRK